MTPARNYLGAVAVVTLASALAGLLREQVAASELVMIFMLGVVFCAARYGRGPSLAASALSVAAFDFFFVPPYFTFAVHDTRFVLTFVAMFVVGAVMGGLTDRVRTEASRAHAAQLQAERQELRNVLLSSVSHDLRTPLAVITGSATALQERRELDPGTRAELLETIRDEADHLNRLVGNLLDMTRLEAGGLAIQKEWMPLEEVVGSALERAQRLLGGRTIQVDLARDLPLVPVDPVLLEQALFNLLDNAARYTPLASVIQVRAQHRDGTVELCVADRGPGVPAGSEAQVFEKFYRAPGNARSGGTGLGLAIVRGIAQAHGGSATVRNRPDGGAEFTITLPAPPPPAEVA